MTYLKMPGQDKIGPISAVLFDKDGTLMDSHSYWGTIIERRARLIADFYKLSADARPDICESMGFCIKSMTLLEKGPVALESRSEVVASVVKFLRGGGTKATAEEINELFETAASQLDNESLPNIRPISTSISLMKSLLNIGLKVAIVTSDTESNTRRFIEQIGFLDSRILVVARDNYPHAKKTGLPAAFAAKTLGVNISECLVIGDAPMDYQMAVNSGALHLLVSSGQLSYESLIESSRYVVEDLNDISLTQIS